MSLSIILLLVILAIALLMLPGWIIGVGISSKPVS